MNQLELQALVRALPIRSNSARTSGGGATHKVRYASTMGSHTISLICNAESDAPRLEFERPPEGHADFSRAPGRTPMHPSGRDAGETALRQQASYGVAGIRERQHAPLRTSPSPEAASVYSASST
jgi:hypothetical protein